MNLVKNINKVVQNDLKLYQIVLCQAKQRILCFWSRKCRTPNSQPFQSSNPPGTCKIIQLLAENNQNSKPPDSADLLNPYVSFDTIKPNNSISSVRFRPSFLVIAIAFTHTRSQLLLFFFSILSIHRQTKTPLLYSANPSSLPIRPT